MARKRALGIQSEKDLAGSQKQLVDSINKLFTKEVVDEFGGEERLLSSLETLSEKLHGSKEKEKDSPKSKTPTDISSGRKIQSRSTKRVN